MKPFLIAVCVLQAGSVAAVYWYSSPWQAWLLALAFSTGASVGAILALLWLDMKGELT